MRDPRINPKQGDALLDPKDGAIVVGRISDGEVMFGCGDHRYWYMALDEWRVRMKEAKVLHAA